ncbi:uncharacterized protein K452DRAFT_298279 [Aplosporella prunicola CBS 121167]|uniref:Uncharacterized protein n=1 Tax=Aplosporella prunicola CBS 121167 TaxID=1176127 RepID=A0A6A6BGC8_9PEZI|nr:uncharacterized protein K452DRAFT_298279 [Aplosporella prunicola CBS 121167]KAF2141571.1 hypothetical protein K452DRAFT_298279 [Aplosporella prunicola CBS 121167]
MADFAWNKAEEGLSHSPEIDIAMGAFSEQWKPRGFTVKNFQEGLPVAGFDGGPVGEKMCRFSGREDPGYQKVSKELKMLVESSARR